MDLPSHSAIWCHSLGAVCSGTCSGSWQLCLARRGLGGHPALETPGHMHFYSAKLGAQAWLAVSRLFKVISTQAVRVAGGQRHGQGTGGAGSTLPGRGCPGAADSGAHAGHHSAARPGVRPHAGLAG